MFPNPLFAGGATGLSVDENATAGTVVGLAPQATDPERGSLRLLPRGYRLHHRSAVRDQRHLEADPGRQTAPYSITRTLTMTGTASR